MASGRGHSSRLNRGSPRFKAKTYLRPQGAPTARERPRPYLLGVGDSAGSLSRLPAAPELPPPGKGRAEYGGGLPE